MESKARQRSSTQPHCLYLLGSVSHRPTFLAWMPMFTRCPVSCSHMGHPPPIPASP